MPEDQGESSEIVSPAEHHERDYVRALVRGLAVIESFEGTPHALTLSEIAKRAELSRGTTRRVLITLQKHGYLTEARGHFALTARVLRLGYAYLSSQSIWTLARPYVEAVTKKTGETASLAVLHGGMIVYLLRLVAPRLLHDPLSIGTRLPAYPASMGRVLLAGLPPAELDRYFRETELRQLTPFTVIDPDRLRAIIARTGKVGFAVNDQEMEVGLRSIAVPITGFDGAVVAALNVSCSTARTSYVEMERDFLPVLRSAAQHVSELLMHSGVGSTLRLPGAGPMGDDSGHLSG